MTADESVRTRESEWLGLPGRVAVMWGMAGGILAGGPVVATELLRGHTSASMVPTMATVMFALGGSAGFVHGALVGVLGRPVGIGMGRTWRSLLRGAVVAVPALGVAWVIALWIALTATAMALGRTTMLVIVVVGWVAGAGICLGALSQGLEALRNAYDRWPEGRYGAPLVILTFGVLLTWFVISRPEFWWTDVHATGLWAVVLAAGVTVWMGLPAVVLVLRLGARRRTRVRGRPAG